MPGTSTGTDLTNRVHLDRFILHKGGKTVDEIAEDEGVEIQTVRKSIRQVEIAQGYHTQEYLNQGIIAIVLESAPSMQKALIDALHAKSVITKKNKNGEEVQVSQPNHEIRLKAVSEIRELAKAAQPKPAHSTKIAVGVGVGVTAQAASGSFVGAEDRMREIKQRMKEGQVIEAGPPKPLPVSVASPTTEEDESDGDEE